MEEQNAEGRLGWLRRIWSWLTEPVYPSYRWRCPKCNRVIEPWENETATLAYHNTITIGPGGGFIPPTKEELIKACGKHMRLR